ncbi:MAG: hypothetical protein AB7V19_00785 [Candidatus Bipolaricaulia bacterium]
MTLGRRILDFALRSTINAALLLLILYLARLLARRDPAGDVLDSLVENWPTAVPIFLALGAVGTLGNRWVRSLRKSRNESRGPEKPGPTD